MAMAENIPEPGPDNQEVGKVIILYGNVKAISIDGTKRLLGPNSPVFAHDQIVTASDGSVSIIIDDPVHTQIDIGRMSHIIIDEDIFAGTTPEDVAAAAAQVEQIQEALLVENFDPTVELEPPAAGEPASAGGGHPVADFARVTHEGEITSGAETTDLTSSTAEDTIQVINESHNYAPTAADDTGTTPEDTPVTVDLAANDTDLDGRVDPATVAIVNGPANGILVNNGDGTVTYTPGADYNGSDSFTYTVQDNSGATSNEATVSIGVDPVNDAPVAGADALNTPEDTPVNIDVLANDSDVDGDTLTVESFTQPTNGIVTENPDGTLTYTPAAGYNGSDSFTYSISDGQGGTDSAAVTVNVDPVNDAPVAADDSGTTSEDTPVIVDLTANDTDLDGTIDPATVTIINGPASGTLTNNGDGTVTYTPGANYNGSDSFTYTVQDNSGATSNEATVSIGVDPVNDAPVAADDSDTTPEDTPVIVDLTANDTDLDGTVDPATVSIVNGPGSGTLTNNGDGTVTYTPGANYNGSDSFTYTVQDNSGAISNEATVSIGVDPVNDAPVAADDAGTTPEDTPVTVDLTANDTDLDGTIDPATVSIVNGPGSGTLTNNGDGTVTYTPGANYNGSDSFTYTVQDNSGAISNEATVSIGVDPVNDAPTAADDALNTPEDTPVNIDVLANDSDVDGDTLTVESFTQPTNGIVTENPDGTLTYTPAADYIGSDSFNYSISDGQGGTDTAAVTVNVGPVNDAPAAADDSGTTPEDTPVTVDLTANDTDLDGTIDPATVTIVNGPGSGTLTNNGDGTVTYTPGANYNGSDSFTYTLQDNSGATSNEATVNIGVDPVNDAPVAADDSGTTPEDTPVIVDLTANDTDLDGTIDPATVTIVNGPANGTLTNNGDGTVTYTPGANYNGSDSFTYTVQDNSGAISNEATVSIGVDPVNDALVAADDSGTTPEDTPVIVDLTANDTDLDGTVDPATVAIVNGPANGTLVNNGDGTVTYTPGANYNGSDTFTYTVQDNSGATSNEATVTIGVNPVNDAPTAADDSGTTPEDTPVTVDLTANDIDLDGTVDPATVAIVNGPANGTLVNNGDGTVTYTPGANYNGSDSFTYTVQDNSGASSNEATVTIGVNPVNDAPTAADDSGTTPEDTPVIVDLTANDTDLDGTVDPATVAIVNGPANGTLTNNGDGTVTYTPGANYNGSDTFTYTVQDNSGATSNEATVTIGVNPVNDAPTAADDVGTTPEDTPVTVDLTANDIDLDGTVDPATVAIVNGPANGTLVNNGDGTVTYTPGADYNGSDTFTYTVQDNSGATSNEATVSIGVDPVNDAPVAADDSGTTPEDTPVTVDLTANDTDLDGTIDPATVSIISGPASGTLTNNGDGTVTYTPGANYNGSDTFTYTVQDNSGATSNEATVSIGVDPVNDAPVAADDSGTTPEDTPVTVDLTANDTDLDGTIDPATVSIISDPASGTLTNNGDGTVTYTPGANYNGSDTFTYTVQDNSGATSNEATVSIGVGPVNDAPVAADDSGTTPEDTPVTVDLTANDTDLDGTINPATVSIINGPANGTLVNNGDGTVTYTPGADYNGSDTFTYTVQDNSGATSNEATVSIGVGPVNDAPTAADDAGTTPEDTPVTVDLTANDTDLDGTIDPATVSIINGPASGTLTNNGDGTVTYTPGANYNGSDTFTYTVQDNSGATSNEATVTIGVGPVNDAPTAADDAGTTPEDTPVTVDLTANDTDLDGTVDPATVAIVNGPANGTLVNNGDGTITYTPGTDYNGSDTFTYTVQDNSGATSNEATVTIGVNPVNDAPMVGNATATVSEEGLPGGIPDTDGTSDTTNSDIDSTALSGQSISVTDPDSGDVHTFTLSGNITDPSTGDPMTLTSNGETVLWDTSDSHQLVGYITDVNNPVITITINDNGEYSVDLDGPIDHPDTTAEDVLSFNIPVNVSDGTATSSGMLTVNVEDDSPTIAADHDAIIANEVGNSLSVPLDIEFGADGPHATTPIQLNGPTVFGYVVDNENHFLTSDGVNLVYQNDGNGGLLAVTEDNATPIFSVAVDPVAENFSVTILGHLDGAAGAVIDLNTGGTDPGIGNEVYFYGGPDSDNDGLPDIQIRITGYDENGAPADVNSSTPGMGVDNNWLDHNPGDNSEQLFMVFSDTATSATYAMTATEITANSLGVGEEAVWQLYNTNGHTSDEFRADPSLWDLVNEGTTPGSASSQSTFVVDGGADPVTGNPITFDAIVLEAGDGDAYRVFDITTFTTDSGANSTISYYNDAGVKVFDADGDYNHTIPVFDVTFDADGNISGTPANEIIAGSSGNDLISGGDGNDAIAGGDGSDMLDGGAGDDHLTGGAGADTFKAAQGNDTITDYSHTDGDIVDISHVFESGDHLEVGANPDGTANLSIVDSGNDLQGSVSFDNINFADLDPTPGVDINGDGETNQLDSLLGQVDVDDGIS